MKLLVANWKMAPDTVLQATDLAKKTAIIAKTHKKTLDIVVCVPYPHLGLIPKSSKALVFGAQTVAGSTALASTGSVSAAMLKAYGCTYCIVGHSESRAKGDTNEIVAEQTKRLIEKKIIPIICIGEKTRDAQGWYLSVIKDQIESVLEGVPKANLKKIVIAYEPIWAIGAEATRVATSLECQEMIIFIRKLLTDLYDEKAARLVPVLYGGSANEENAATFIDEGGASGLLVGRVSLEPKRFAALAARIAIVNS